ncbi:MAG: hypothetical protein RR413_02730 [Christensenellaceae bacterium]
MTPEFRIAACLHGNLLECGVYFEKTDDTLYELAYYLYCGNTRIKTFWYAPVRTLMCFLEQPGEYRVEAYLRLQGEENPIITSYSNSVEFTENNPQPFMKLQAFFYEGSLEATAVLPQHKLSDYLFAFRIYHNDAMIKEIWYSHNEQVVFPIKATGEYRVECFVAKEVGIPFVSQKSDVLTCQLPPDSEPVQLKLLSESWTKRLLKKFLLGVPLKYDEAMSINTQCSGDQLTCKLCGFSSKMFVAWFVLLKNREAVQQQCSFNGQAIFSIQPDGDYLVKCFIRTPFGRFYLQSSMVHRGKLPIYAEEYQHVTLTPPPFILSPEPFVDFCVIFTSQSLSDDMTVKLDMDGFEICRKTQMGDKTVFLLAPKDFELKGDILLSGFIYERNFIYGQKSIEDLPEDFLIETAFTEMTGSFASVKYQQNDVILTTDLFGAGHLYCFENDMVSIVSNRLHLTLLTMHAIKVKPDIDSEYISASLCYSEKMISVTNFTTDMIFKGLHLLPLNQYIRFSAQGMIYQTKTMVYEQMPYQEDKYRKLLDLAKDDIIRKTNALAESNLFNRYIQEVTGGFDSRVALSATLNCPQIVDKMRIRTMDVSTSKDLHCSLAQTNYYHLHYYARQEDPVNIVPVTLELKDFRNRSMAMGTYRSLAVDPYPYYRIDTTAVCFGGYFGETMRSRYFGAMQESLLPTDTAELVVRKFMQRIVDDAIVSDSKSQAQFAARLQKQIEQMPGHTAVEQFDNMYTFFHLRYHFGLNEYQTKVSNMIRLAPYMSKYMLYASKMLSMQQRYENKIMYEMAHWLKPEIIAFPYSSYGLQDENIQLDSHKQGLLLKEPNQLHVELDFDDHKYREVAKKNKEFSQHCDEQLAQTKEGSEKRDATRFIYLRILKILDSLAKEAELSFPWEELRSYTFFHRHDNENLQPLYCKLMGIYDQLDIVLGLDKKL